MGFVQEDKVLACLKGVNKVVQVIEYDDGARSTGNRVAPHLYLEFLNGEDLHDTMIEWAQVRTQEHTHTKLCSANPLIKGLAARALY